MAGPFSGTSKALGFYGSVLGAAWQAPPRGGVGLDEDRRHSHAPSSTAYRPDCSPATLLSCQAVALLSGITIQDVNQ